MSELATLVSYQYPVHQISAEFYPSQITEIVYVVVYRDTTDEVNFTLINAVSAHLLNSIMKQGRATVDSLTKIMIEAMPQLDVHQITGSLQQVIKQLLLQEILFLAEQ
jgi:hypothetical protein